MKLHYKGKYNLNPESLPHGEHKPNAQPFKEPKDTREIAIIANVGCVILTVILGIAAYFRCGDNLFGWQFGIGCIASLLFLFPHELLHAICFENDVYLYVNLKQGMLFVVGPETMSKGRFIFMSLLPNIVFGLIPYVAGLLFPQYVFLVVFGTFSLGAGFGDYCNVFNALTQMPKGSRTYLYQLNSFWYLPK